MMRALLFLVCLLGALSCVHSWTKHCFQQGNVCTGKKAGKVCGLHVGSGKYHIYKHLCDLHIKACRTRTNIAVMDMYKCNQGRVQAFRVKEKVGGQPIRNVFVRPGQQRVLEGSNVQIVCFVEGGKPTIRWDVNDTIKSNPQSGTISSGGGGITTSTLELLKISRGRSGTYTCNAYDSDVSLSAEATVDVQYHPAARAEPTYLSIFLGETATFSCVTSGNPKPSVVWKKGDDVVSSSSQLIVQKAQLTDHGEYKCLAKNAISEASAIVHLNVKVNGGWGKETCTDCGRNPYNNDKCQRKCNRKCDNPPPANGGQSCPGNDVFAKDCNPDKCKVPNDKKKCFPGDAAVPLASGGSVLMRDLKVGDVVLAVTRDDKVTPTRVLTFLHKEEDTDVVYRNIQTDQQSIRLSADHLIFASEAHSADAVQDVFASKLRPGMFIKEASNDRVVLKRVVTVSNVTAAGMYAPLTEHGNIIVDNVMTSCYAVLTNHWLAHVGLTPLRWYYMYGGLSHDDVPKNGVHWYPTLIEPMLAVLPHS